METTYNIHPPEARWTHVALRVKDINATIEWYTENTPLSLVTRREDETGMQLGLATPTIPTPLFF